MRREVEERRLTGSFSLLVQKSMENCCPTKENKPMSSFMPHTVIPHTPGLILDQSKVSSASVACSRGFLAPKIGKRLSGITVV